MSNDLIRGKTIRFTFRDGPMAHKTFEHVFAEVTSVLDFKTRELVAFSSNDKMLSMQHGTFEQAR
jgi:hypothetical protein